MSSAKNSLSNETWIAGGLGFVAGIAAGFGLAQLGSLRAERKQKHAFLKRALGKNFMFRSVPETLKNKILDSFSKIEIKDSVIIKRGDTGDLFYIVEEGSADCYVLIEGKEVMVRTFYRGDSFGELGVLHNEPRNATIRARGQVSLLACSKTAIQTHIVPFMQEKIAKNKPILQKAPLLASVEGSHLEKIAEALVTEHFTAGHPIVRQGDPGDKFYFLQEGTVDVIVDGKKVATLTAVQYFGERALVTGEPRNATIQAVGPVKTLSLDQAGFNVLLGPKVKASLLERIRSYEQKS